MIGTALLGNKHAILSYAFGSRWLSAAKVILPKIDHGSDDTSGVMQTLCMDVVPHSVCVRACVCIVRVLVCAPCVCFVCICKCVCGCVCVHVYVCVSGVCRSSGSFLYHNNLRANDPLFEHLMCLLSV